MLRFISTQRKLTHKKNYFSSHNKFHHHDVINREKGIGTTTTIYKNTASAHPMRFHQERINNTTTFNQLNSLLQEKSWTNLILKCIIEYCAIRHLLAFC